MAQQVRIFTEELLNLPGYSNAKDLAPQRAEAMKRLEQAVSQCLQEAADQIRSVEWLQSSGASGSGSFTQLTAIVRFGS